MRRRGFTVIEIVLSVALGLLVTAGIYSLMGLAIRSFGTSRSKLTNLQAAVLLVCHLEDDLNNLWQDPDHRIDVSDKARLVFHSLDRENSRFARGVSEPRVAIVKIVYEFDVASNRVRRRVGAEPWRWLPGNFESVAFFFIKPDYEDGATQQFNNYFNLRITCATGSELATNRDLPSFQDGRRVTKGVFTLIASVGADVKTRQNLYPVWNEVPDVKLVEGAE